MKFGRDYARRLKRKRASRRDIWRLDEVVVTIGGKQHWLWRAVDQDGYILDEIVQTRRDTNAAKRLLTRLLKKQGCPMVLPVPSVRNGNRASWWSRSALSRTTLPISR